MHDSKLHDGDWEGEDKVMRLPFAINLERILKGRSPETRTRVEAISELANAAIRLNDALGKSADVMLSIVDDESEIAVISAAYTDLRIERAAFAEAQRRSRAALPDDNELHETAGIVYNQATRMLDLMRGLLGPKHTPSGE